MKYYFKYNYLKLSKIKNKSYLLKLINYIEIAKAIRLFYFICIKNVYYFNKRIK